MVQALQPALPVQRVEIQAALRLVADGCDVDRGAEGHRPSLPHLGHGVALGLGQCWAALLAAQQLDLPHGARALRAADVEQHRLVGVHRQRLVDGEVAQLELAVVETQALEVLEQQVDVGQPWQEALPIGLVVAQHRVLGAQEIRSGRRRRHTRPGRRQRARHHGRSHFGCGLQRALRCSSRTDVPPLQRRQGQRAAAWRVLRCALPGLQDHVHVCAAIGKAVDGGQRTSFSPGRGLACETEGRRTDVEVLHGLLARQERHAHAVRQHRRRLDERCHALGRERMPDVGLGGAQFAGHGRSVCGPVDRLQRLQLQQVGHFAAGAVDVDVAHLLGRRAAVVQRALHHRLLGLQVRRRRAGGAAVVVDGQAPDHGMDAVAVAQRLLHGLQQHHAHAFAQHHTASAAVEDVEFAGAGQQLASLEQAMHLVRTQQADATHQRGTDLAGTQRVHRHLHRHQRRRAGGVDHQARSAQVKALRQVGGKVVLPHRDDRIARLRQRAVVRPVVAACTDEDPGLAALHLPGLIAGVVEHAQAFLQQHQGLRVHGCGIAVRDQEVAGVEVRHVVEQAGVECRGVPPPFGRHGLDAGAPFGQQLPERVEVGRAREAARQAHHRDVQPRAGHGGGTGFARCSLRRERSRRHRGQDGWRGGWRRSGRCHRRHPRPHGHHGLRRRQRPAQGLGVRAAEPVRERIQRRVLVEHRRIERLGLAGRVQGVVDAAQDLRQHDRIDAIVGERHLRVQGTWRQHQFHGKQTGQPGHDFAAAGRGRHRRGCGGCGGCRGCRGGRRRSAQHQSLRLPGGVRDQRRQHHRPWPLADHLVEQAQPLGIGQAQQPRLPVGPRRGLAHPGVLPRRPLDAHDWHLPGTGLRDAVHVGVGRHIVALARAQRRHDRRHRREQHHKLQRLALHRGQQRVKATDLGCQHLLDLGQRLAHEGRVVPVVAAGAMQQAADAAQRGADALHLHAHRVGVLQRQRQCLDLHAQAFEPLHGFNLAHQCAVTCGACGQQRRPAGAGWQRVAAAQHQLAHAVASHEVLGAEQADAACAAGDPEHPVGCEGQRCRLCQRRLKLQHGHVAPVVAVAGLGVVTGNLPLGGNVLQRSFVASGRIQVQVA